MNWNLILRRMWRDYVIYMSAALSTLPVGIFYATEYIKYHRDYWWPCMAVGLPISLTVIYLLNRRWPEP